MSTDTPGDESPHDSDEQYYDTAAAAAIARDRLADEVDPAEFGQARDVSEALADLAADLRKDDLTVTQLGGVCTELELLYEALRDVSELHGWGWEENPDAHTTNQPEPDTEPGVETPPQFPGADE